MQTYPSLEKTVVSNAEFYAFEQLPENVNRMFELINGEIVEMPSPRPMHNWILFHLAVKIQAYLDANPTGEVYTDNIDLELAPGMVIKPDVAYFDYSREDDVPEKFTFAPDLAVEVISPSNRASDIDEKIEAYLEYGSKLVWIIYPATKSVRVHRKIETGERAVATLTENDTLTGGNVLPGFSVPVARLFRVRRNKQD